MEMKRLIQRVSHESHKLEEWMERTIENRKTLLEARGINNEDPQKKADEKKDISLKLPKPKVEAKAQWIIHCNKNVLKDTMCCSSPLAESSLKTFAIRPALEWAMTT